MIALYANNKDQFIGWMESRGLVPFEIEYRMLSETCISARDLMRYTYHVAVGKPFCSELLRNIQERKSLSLDSKIKGHLILVRKRSGSVLGRLVMIPNSAMVDKPEPSRALDIVASTILRMEDLRRRSIEPVIPDTRWLKEMEPWELELTESGLTSILARTTLFSPDQGFMGLEIKDLEADKRRESDELCYEADTAIFGKGGSNDSGSSAN